MEFWPSAKDHILAGPNWVPKVRGMSPVTQVIKTDAEQPASPRTILLVDDEPDVLDTLAAFLETYLEGARVLTAADAHHAVELLEHEPIDVVISDYRMPGMDGLQFLKRAKELAPDTPRVMITAFPQLPVATRAVDEAHIHQYFVKPFDPEDLLATIRDILARPDPEPLAKSWVDRFFERRGAGPGVGA